jgi:AcrR family transcriptional regulator
MPRQPQQARAKATVSAIVEAAAILLAQSGPKALTTRKIAERAGTGVGSVYEYFRNRDAVIDAVYAQLIDEAVTTVMQADSADVRISLRDRVHGLLHALQQLLLHNDGRWLACVRHAPRLLRQDPTAPLQDALRQQLRALAPEAVTGDVAQRWPVLAYICINGGIFLVARHLSDPQPPVSFDALIDGLADMVVATLAGLPDTAAPTAP